MKCSITTSASTTCGAAAVSSFVASCGETFAECAVHNSSHLFPEAITRRAGHPPTRTTRAFVLVRDGIIVGYSDTDGDRAAKRARRLGADLVRAFE